MRQGQCQGQVALAELRDNTRAYEPSSYGCCPDYRSAEAGKILSAAGRQSYSGDFADGPGGVSRTNYCTAGAIGLREIDDAADVDGTFAHIGRIGVLARRSGYAD